MTNFQNHLQIEMVDSSTLIVSKTHARKHGPKQVEQIACGIRRIGFVVPIIADDNNVIAAGVGRLKAALLLQLELVPLIRVKFVSEADRRAFALADNKIAEGSEWDDDKLKDELQFLLDTAYDFSFTGFNLSDLDLGVPTTSPSRRSSCPTRRRWRSAAWAICG